MVKLGAPRHPGWWKGACIQGTHTRDGGAIFREQPWRPELTSRVYLGDSGTHRRKVRKRERLGHSEFTTRTQRTLRKFQDQSDGYWRGHKYPLCEPVTEWAALRKEATPQGADPCYCQLPAFAATGVVSPSVPQELSEGHRGESQQESIPVSIGF